VLVADILKKTRTQPLVEARQYAVWLTKNNTSLSLKQIGKLFNIHYSTVIYAVKNINGLIEVNQLRVQ
jgi:chromosomal replication initiator protein